MHSIGNNKADDQDIVIHMLIPAEGGEAANIKEAAASLGTTPEGLVQELYIYAMCYPPEVFVQWFKERQALNVSPLN